MSRSRFRILINIMKKNNSPEKLNIIIILTLPKNAVRSFRMCPKYHIVGPNFGINIKIIEYIKKVSVSIKNILP